MLFFVQKSGLWFLFVLSLCLPLSYQYAAYRSNDPVSKRLEELIQRVSEAANEKASIQNTTRYSTLRAKTDKLEEAVNRELNVTRS